MCGYCSSTTLSGPCPVCSPGAAAAPYVRPTKRAKASPAKRRPARATQPQPPSPAPRPTWTPPPAPPRPAPTPRPGPSPLPLAARGGAYRSPPLTDRDTYQDAPLAAPAPTLAPQVRTRWASMGAEQRARALVGLREDVAARDFNAAAGRLAHLADEAWARARVLHLAEIDARCVRTGKLSKDDETARRSIVEQCVAELGFDPRTEDGPVAKVIQLVPPTAAARGLPSGELPPLVAGDWAELGRRVAMGVLSEEDARGFGAVWMEHASSRA